MAKRVNCVTNLIGLERDHRALRSDRVSLTFKALEECKMIEKQLTKEQKMNMFMKCIQNTDLKPKHRRMNSKFKSFTRNIGQDNPRLEKVRNSAPIDLKAQEERFKKVVAQQEVRRKKALLFKEANNETDIKMIYRNFKALQKIDERDIETLSKVIENSIVFSLSKQGKFSQFKAGRNPKEVTNAQKRRRKFMIGMANNTHAHQYLKTESENDEEEIILADEFSPIGDMISSAMDKTPFQQSLQEAQP